MRISAISYLNTAPLMWDFEHATAGDQFDISYTMPSQCARELQNGNADIGIIPSAAYASIPGLSIIPGVAIASKQAVRSILLVSPKPMDDICTSHSTALLSLQQRWPGSCSKGTGAEADNSALLLPTSTPCWPKMMPRCSSVIRLCRSIARVTTPGTWLRNGFV